MTSHLPFLLFNYQIEQMYSISKTYKWYVYVPRTWLKKRAGTWCWRQTERRLEEMWLKKGEDTQCWGLNFEKLEGYSMCGGTTELETGGRASSPTPLFPTTLCYAI